MRMDLARFDARSLLCFVHDQLYALGSFMRQYLASRCTSRMVQSTFRSLNVTMSIHRCSQLLLLWVLLCIFAMSCVQARQDAEVSKCAKNGQYCQVHWQCCSGKCMTYTYKCAPKVPQVLYDNKASATGIEYLPELWRHVFNPTREQIDIVTLNDVYKINDNTIQSSEKADMAHDSSNPPSTDSCLPVGQACSESRQCCRKRCHTYLHRCVT